MIGKNDPKVFLKRKEVQERALEEKRPPPTPDTWRDVLSFASQKKVSEAAREERRETNSRNDGVRRTLARKGPTGTRPTPVPGEKEGTKGVL